jgi:UDP-2,3-diacylglucosamine pyrophosphatase LpxH
MNLQWDRHTLRANGVTRVARSPMPSTMPPPIARRVRTCFLSDIHLGFRGCRAEYLLEFLGHLQCDTLYLVGDIVDFWSLKRSIYWPRAHHDVLRALLDRARCGTRVVYIPGNHDHPFREFDGWVLGEVEIVSEAVHETADGRRFLVLHGDGFDSMIRASPLLETLGNHTYALVLRLNRYVDAVRRRCGYPYWSVAAFLKHRVGNAVRYIANFERAMAFEARRRGMDGLVCGHIHRAAIADIDGITYCNDGDWVESCTALVEDFDGGLSLVRWTEESQLLGASAHTRPVGGRIRVSLAA